jgi:sulfatase modifying factor 1
MLDDLKKLLARERKEPRPAAPAFPFSSGAAREYQQAYSRWSGLPLLIGDQSAHEFMLIPPGQFLMGSPEDESGRSKEYEETLHPVRLTEPFYLARYETTVGQFRKFVERTGFVTDGEKNDGGNAHDEQAVWKHRPGTNWRRPGFAAPFTLKNDHPVVQVSHADATAYCDWLNRREGTGVRYALPTEAQWEWACRAGTATRYWWGNDVDDTGKVANVGDERLKQVQPKWPREIMPMNDRHAFLAPVGTFRSNPFGLRDMLGNVWEFTSTRYGNYPKELSIDPGDLSTDRGFVPRGGGWSNVAADVRSASRNADPPHFCHSNLGFRVAIKLDLPSSAP